MPRKNAVRCQCQQCHQPFDALDYRVNRPPKFCSRACRDAARTTRVDLVCRQCGQTFQRKAYQETWSQERGPFCGQPCYGQWQRGRQGNRWNGPGRYSQEWEENRAVALERDGHRCVRCGRSGCLLQVHHVRHWNPDDPETHAVDNLETLCAGCHRRQHPMERGPDGRFLPREQRSHLRA